jgi:hypothetical protein
VQSKVVDLLPPIIEFEVLEIDMGKKAKLKVAGVEGY